MNATDNLESFEFFISQRGEVAVVTMVGSVLRDHSEKLEECARAIESLPAQFVILNVRDIKDVKEPFVRPFARMQQAIRKRGDLRISGLRPEHREVLTNFGLIRSHEIVNNLSDAIRDFMLISKKSAA